VDVRIDPEDGEILVKGPNVFLGYYKEEAATRDSFTEDGWLRTGDLGTFDEKGFLRITGRKKDIIITAGGKNIAPRNIEEALKAHELIAEAVVIGDRRKFLTALITLDADAARKFAEARGLDPNGLHADMETRAEIQAVVDQVNHSLARVEQLKKFTILPRNFTIEDGELTPTLKIKRKIVNEHFSGEIEAMYQEPDAARAARE
jgi:long-chain acyl-CoA synthetase